MPRTRISNGESVLRSLELIARNRFLTESGDDPVAAPAVEVGIPTHDDINTVVTVRFKYDDEGNRHYEYLLTKAGTALIDRDMAVRFMDWED